MKAEEHQGLQGEFLFDDILVPFNVVMQVWFQNNGSQWKEVFNCTGIWIAVSVLATGAI
jgi:hypothetical protein